MRSDMVDLGRWMLATASADRVTLQEDGSFQLPTSPIPTRCGRPARAILISTCGLMRWAKDRGTIRHTDPQTENPPRCEPGGFQLDADVLLAIGYETDWVGVKGFHSRTTVLNSFHRLPLSAALWIFSTSKSGG